MSHDNHYPLTRPSQELTQDVTAALGLPFSPALNAHLQTCRRCYEGDQGMCSTAREMVAEVRYLAHREGCTQCRFGAAMCEEGEVIWRGN